MKNIPGDFGNDRLGDLEESLEATQWARKAQRLDRSNYSHPSGFVLGAYGGIGTTFLVRTCRANTDPDSSSTGLVIRDIRLYIRLWVSYWFGAFRTRSDFHH